MLGWFPNLNRDELCAGSISKAPTECLFYTYIDTTMPTDILLNEYNHWVSYNNMQCEIKMLIPKNKQKRLDWNCKRHDIQCLTTSEVEVSSMNSHSKH